jgi:hypothetical protein
MERASQQAQTQTTATPEASRATPASAQGQAAPTYFGNRAALRRLAAGNPLLQRSLLPQAASPLQVSRKCAHCEEEEEKATVQRKENGAERAGQATAPAAVHEALRGSGQPLDPDTRAFMEPRFGSSFDQVRIHTGAQPSESARSIGASAYTVGRDIVFAAGQYAPDSAKGRRLLAHELTHVLQQGSESAAPAAQRKLEINTPGDAFEQEADQVADRVMRSAEPGAVSSAPTLIQRDEAPVDIGAVTADIEKMVRPGNDEKGALDKLKAMDMSVLLKVVEQLFDDGAGSSGDEGKQNSYAILGNDILPPDARKAGAGDSLNVDERTKLRAAWDAAPTRKLRNPKEGDSHMNPEDTLSGARDKSKSTMRARPGDWGEDPGGNTWVCHTDGIRSYFGSGITPESKRRTSTWLGNNPSNFDYTPTLTKRAIGSFHWGKGAHHFAIYLSEADASADLKERVKGKGTVLNYVTIHLGNRAADKNESAETYINHMNSAVKVSAGDPIDSWASDASKWDDLIKGFKAAEGWNPSPKVITASTVDSLSTEAKDAPLIAYYKKLLGVGS